MPWRADELVREEDLEASDPTVLQRVRDIETMDADQPTVLRYWADDGDWRTAVFLPWDGWHLSGEGSVPLQRAKDDLTEHSDDLHTLLLVLGLRVACRPPEILLLTEADAPTRGPAPTAVWTALGEAPVGALVAVTDGSRWMTFTCRGNGSWAVPRVVSAFDAALPIAVPGPDAAATIRKAVQRGPSNMPVIVQHTPAANSDHSVRMPGDTCWQLPSPWVLPLTRSYEDEASGPRSVEDVLQAQLDTSVRPLEAVMLS